ncbi:hypothetical protein [Lentzea sp. NPDC051838]|uniref:hypothetical protein n=1 Tax=Lentzea sp. NPDC051838 TaxID=3154849 RepID=UPI00341B9FE8
MAEGDYRQQLRAVVSASAAPHGYTLTLWTAGAITTHAEGGVPSAVDALLLLVGAVTGFGAVGALAFGGVNRVLDGQAAGVRVWGGLHLPSVGVSMVLVTVLTSVVHGHLAWPLVGGTATVAYLLVLAAQFRVAGHSGRTEEGLPGR